MPGDVATAAGCRSFTSIGSRLFVSPGRGRQANRRLGKGHNSQAGRRAQGQPAFARDRRSEHGRWNPVRDAREWRHPLRRARAPRGRPSRDRAQSPQGRAPSHLRAGTRHRGGLVAATVRVRGGPARRKVGPPSRARRSRFVRLEAPPPGSAWTFSRGAFCSPFFKSSLTIRRRVLFAVEQPMPVLVIRQTNGK